MSRQKIVCAAIRLDDSSKIFYGHRHSHCLEAMYGELSWNLNRQQIKKLKKTQGFITTEMRFVDRFEAFKIAKEMNQIDPNNVRGDKLYGKDLY